MQGMVGDVKRTILVCLGGILGHGCVADVVLKNLLVLQNTCLAYFSKEIEAIEEPESFREVEIV